MYPFPRFRRAVFPPFLRALQIEIQHIFDIYETPSFDNRWTELFLTLLALDTQFIFSAGPKHKMKQCLYSQQNLLKFIFINTTHASILPFKYISQNRSNLYEK